MSREETWPNVHFIGMGGMMAAPDLLRAHAAQPSASQPSAVKPNVHFIGMGGMTVVPDSLRAHAAQPSAGQPSAGQPSAALPCPSWILVTSTNVHIAKDRSWFGADYKPISSALTSGAAVIGIGTVNLPVKTTPEARHREHGTITLRDVLHVPSALCNIVGTPLFQDFKVRLETDPGSNGSISLSDGAPVAYFTPRCGLCEVRLSGPPVGPRVGPSPFKPGIKYMINAGWPETEREKWLHAPAASPSGDAPQKSFYPSEEEERWLQRRFGIRHKILMGRHGLSMEKEEDRETGWHIVRRARDAEESSVLGPEYGYMKGLIPFSEIEWLKDHHGKLETFLQREGLDPEDRVDVALVRIDRKKRRLEDPDGADFCDSDDSYDVDWDNGGPERLLCNSYFGPDELKWIKARYDNTVHFMVMMGLKFTDPADGKKAAEKVRAFMTEEARRWRYS